MSRFAAEAKEGEQGQAVAQPVPPSRSVEALNGYYDQGQVVLVARAPDGTIRLDHSRAASTCFLLAAEADRELLRMLRESPEVLAVTDEGKFVRVTWRDRDFCHDACRALARKGMLTFEGTVPALRRLCVDRDVKVVRPRGFYLDIETDSRVPFSRKEEARILCWAVVDHDTDEEYEGVLEADTDEAERAMLARFWDLVERYDQGRAWNGDRFDYPVMLARTKRARLSVNDKRLLWLDHLDLFSRMNVMAAESGDEKQSMKLDSIARVVLGEGKDEFDSSKTWEAWSAAFDCQPGPTPAAACKRCRGCLVRYCRKDARLLKRIEDKTGYIELLQTLCEVTGAFPDSRGINPSSQAETFLLKLGSARGFRFPTRFPTKEEQFEGALVMQPKVSGVQRDVHVGDFKSMYPSIILTWNMSHETRVERPQFRPSYLPPERGRPANTCEAATGTRFRTDVEGILAIAVAEMLRLRRHWEERKAKLTPNTPEWKEADRRSTAYKIAANAVFGCSGAPMLRMFDRAVAEGVSVTGKWLIEQTIAEFEASGSGRVVIYADTDGFFAVGCTVAEFAEFVSRCNAELYPRLTAERGCKANHIKLAVKPPFKRLVFPLGAKGEPSAKRYAAKLYTDGSAPEIKGLEFKRGDGAKLARTMQACAIDLVVQRECDDPAEVEALVRRWQRRVMEGPISLEDCVKSQRLNKDLKHYLRKPKKDGGQSRLPPHVEVGLELRKRGADVGDGSKVEYVCTDGASKPKRFIPAEDWTEGCVDRHELWESAVWPPTERFLAGAFPGVDWSAWSRTRPKTPHARSPKGQSDPEQGILALPRPNMGP